MMYAGDECLSQDDGAPDVGDWDCPDCTPFLCSCDTDEDPI